MSRRHGACPCAWRRKPLWATTCDRARAQLTRECDTATMGAPRQGINPAPRVRGPLDGGAHTVFATAAKRPAPARGRCLPSPSFESGAVHSRGATDCAPMLWSGPRPRPIARRAHCGRAGHPPKVSGRPHWVRRPSHHHPPKQASGCPQPTAAPSGRCGQPEANPPPCPCEQEGGSVATASDRHVVRIVPRCRPRRCGRSSGKGFPSGTPGIPLSDLWSHRE